MMGEGVRYSPLIERMEIFDWETEEHLDKADTVARLNQQDWAIKEMLEVVDKEIAKCESLKDTSAIADILWIGLKDLRRKLVGVMDSE